MAENQNVEQIKSMYAAFGRGDIQAIIENTSDNIVWDHSGASELPFNQVYHGAAGVRSFFSILTETLDVELFEPQKYLADADTVVAIGRMKARMKSTGKGYEVDWAMAYTFADGRVTKFRIYSDTVASVAALRP